MTNGHESFWETEFPLEKQLKINNLRYTLATHREEMGDPKVMIVQPWQHTLEIELITAIGELGGWK